VFESRLTRSPSLVVPDLRGVPAAVAAGAGVTVLPRYLCATEPATGALRPLLEPELPPINTLFLATRDGPVHQAVSAVRSRLPFQGRLW
jgi:DNA-binding transcriptional LysR family regulator